MAGEAIDTNEFQDEESVVSRFKKGDRVAVKKGPLAGKTVTINKPYQDIDGISYNCAIDGTDAITSCKERDLEQTLE